MSQPAYTRAAAALPALMNQRILVLDGAMGTMVQRWKLTEADFRGDAFRRSSQWTCRATTTCWC
jgi:5-methyltetrahydrofolate--homocysteine methyltransferase